MYEYAEKTHEYARKNDRQDTLQYKKQEQTYTQQNEGQTSILPMQLFTSSALHPAFKTPQRDIPTHFNPVQAFGLDTEPYTDSRADLPPYKHTVQKKENSVKNNVIQKVPAPVTVTGLTHLVQAKGDSIFEGEEIMEVTNETPILIDTDKKMRSRRGPNQEKNRAEDLSGEHIYRWFKVLKINNNPAPKNTYIRDDTFTSTQKLSNRPAIISDKHRDRDDSISNQNAHLLGTTHSSNEQYNKSKKVEDSEFKDSTLIVEHPTPIGSQPTTLDTGVKDITQENLIKRAGEKGVQVIGGDGRKMIDKEQKHALSLRGQPQTLEINSGVTITADGLSKLAEQYINISLGLEETSVQEAIQKIDAIGKYKSEKGSQVPDVKKVLLNDYKRVNTITKYFKPGVKKAVSEKIMAVLNHDLEELETDYEENKISYTEYYTSKKDFETLKIEIGNLEAKLYIDMISSFHDAISNLTLFSEVLANNKSNLIVAFGDEHVKPLKELLEDNRVEGVHKNYTVKKE